jgi:hypothetical protein
MRDDLEELLELAIEIERFVALAADDADEALANCGDDTSVKEAAEAAACDARHAWRVADDLVSRLDRLERDAWIANLEAA